MKTCRFKRFLASNKKIKNVFILYLSFFSSTLHLFFLYNFFLQKKFIYNTFIIYFIFRLSTCFFIFSLFKKK